MKYQNGVREIKPIQSREVTRNDWLMAMFHDLAGAKVSSIKEKNCETPLISRWEVFDPEKVEDKNSLPYPWNFVYVIHNQPSRKDCITGRYRYVHSPKPILPQYPMNACSGLFVITNRKARIASLEGDDLIWIGDEFKEELGN